MTVLAESQPAARAGAAPKPWGMPALLLAPCLAWISFFFLAPLALMCWKSIASEGLEPYATLFSSPLYTKVMLTTVRAAAVATM